MAKKKIAKKKKAIGKSGKKKSGKKTKSKVFTFADLIGSKIVLHNRETNQAFLGNVSAIAEDGTIIGDYLTHGEFVPYEKDPNQLEIPDILKTPDENADDDEWEKTNLKDYP